MGLIAGAVVGIGGAIAGGVMGSISAQAQQRQIENQMDNMWLQSRSNYAETAKMAVSGQGSAVSTRINTIRSEQVNQVLAANYASTQASLQEQQSQIQASTGIAASGVGAYSDYKADQLATKRHTELTQANQPFAPN